MSVKELLAKQEAGFISLHEVLRRMTQIDGATYKEAAIALFRILDAADKSAPGWWVKDKIRGVFPASNSDEKAAWQCLVEAATFGEPTKKTAPSFEDLGDEIPF